MRLMRVRLQIATEQSGAWYGTGPMEHIALPGFTLWDNSAPQICSLAFSRLASGYYRSGSKSRILDSTKDGA